MDDAFHEVRFPTDIGFGSVGGPNFRTDITKLPSGHERRTPRWQVSLETWNVAYGVKDDEQLERLLEFFYARWGRAYGFRFKNPRDYRSVNAVCNPVAGGAYQTFRHYVSGPATYSRKIVKPIEETVEVFVDGVEAESGWSVDETTGLITFSSSPYPSVVTATFEFDVPVRFNQDGLEESIDSYNQGAAAVTLTELKP